MWQWMTSNRDAMSASLSRSTAQTAPGFGCGRLSRTARGQIGTRDALVTESPLANSVTSWPSATSSSVSQATTRSVPP
jgi:hypothetical protein